MKKLSESVADNSPSSPFHPGEQAIQTRLGVRENMERFGRKVIRDHMPVQHRDFFNQLPYVFIGHADNAGWPWASILVGEPGFMVSDSPTRLSIKAQSLTGDTLEEFLVHAAADQSAMGLLGIDLDTRRRNRLSAHVAAASNGSIELKISQSFGNCPQYIQTRDIQTDNTLPSTSSTQKNINEFDEEALTLIQGADTFFVSSYVATNRLQASSGVDVSHRGGRPGFVRTDDAYTLTIPDYLGNFHFNTLGNFLENPKAGLMFIDFEYGHILALTGTVEILWDSPDVTHFKGAERFWRFRLDHGRWLKNVLPIKFAFGEYSPNNTLTGTWAETEKIKQSAQQRDRWMPYVVVDIVKESSAIKSFFLKSPNGHIPNFDAGQFLTLRTDTGSGLVARTYTVSSAPEDEFYRISVKHEQHSGGTIPDGEFSSFLHQNIISGDILEIKAPTGCFKYDAAYTRPAVFISGGIGITPLVSMARHALIEGLRTRHIRPLTLICAAHNHAQRAFFTELNEITEKSAGAIRVFWVLSNPEPHLLAGVDFQQRGRVSKGFLLTVLPMDDYDAYVCGPKGFMQFVYDLLRSLGTDDQRIYAESFGPASLQRNGDFAPSTEKQAPVADQAVVEFSESRIEQAWSKGAGSLLEFAEKHGLSPEYGCRSGQCGACKTTLLSGEVSYTQTVSVDLASDEVLLCCAEPAASEGGKVALISLQL